MLQKEWQNTTGYSFFIVCNLLRVECLKVETFEGFNISYGAELERVIHLTLKAK